MSIKRSRNARKRAMNYLSPGQRKSKRIGNAAVVVSGVIAVLGLSLVIFFGRNWIMERFPLPEAQASEENPTAETNDPTLDENEALLEKQKKEEQEKFEAYVLSVEPDFQFAHFKGEPTLKKTGDPILDEANRLAAGYDYDGAVAKIKSVTGYGNMPAYKEALASYYAEKAALLRWEINNNITHIFFHSLIVNPGITFNKEITDFKLNDYNEAMTTVNEFVAIMESMYEKGFVLVDIYDVAKMEIQEDGSKKMKYQALMLPEGKIPFLLSIDDTNYYEYMDGQGFPQHLLVDENGKVTNDYRLTNGEIVYGSFDVITILEDFIEMHPDFSYKNGRGISGITGYNGVLGYRTSDFWYTEGCPYYESTPANDKYFREEIVSGYNKNIEEDKKKATETANAIKALNWHFASHTWGHKRLGEVAIGTITWDSDMWKREVQPILGDTDLLIFPYGNDIGQGVSWRTYEYQGYNERFRTLKSYGFDYYFNVDSSVYFMQRTDDYFRQGRRNLDGDRLWEAVKAFNGDEKRKNRTLDLFDDPTLVIDPLRPELEK